MGSLSRVGRTKLLLVKMELKYLLKRWTMPFGFEAVRNEGNVMRNRIR